MKNKSRQEQSLDPIAENPAKVIARMPPISPPLAGAECLDMQGQIDGGSSARRAKRQVKNILTLVTINSSSFDRALRNNQHWIPML